MTYTFYHAGILIGESDLEDPGDNPGQRGGIFRPTAYGMDIFPRLTGILSAGAELQAYFESRGVTPEDLTRAEVEELLDTTPAGRKILDIGRMLSEVEIRTPNGRSVEFASIAFIDQTETLRVSRQLTGSAACESPPMPPGAPRYAVSATLRKGGPFSRRERRRDRQRWQ